MPELNLRTDLGDVDAFRKIVTNGISEERKKIEYALERTYGIIKDFEAKYCLSSVEFLRDFQEGKVEESGDTFQWWAELKVSRELEDKLNMVDTIEICQ